MFLHYKLLKYFYVDIDFIFLDRMFFMSFELRSAHLSQRLYYNVIIISL